MGHIVSRILFAAGILLSLSYGAYAAVDEQLLPPMEPGTTSNCDVTHHPNNVLMLYDNGTGGTSAINCNLHFTADPGGMSPQIRFYFRARPASWMITMPTR